MRKSKTHLDTLNPKSGQVIWRYLDFPRFFSLLESESLYFSRLDLLGDPFEGSVTKHDLKDEKDQWMAMSQESGTPAGLYSYEFRSRPDDPRKSIFVSCWHMSMEENVAMWSLYSDKHKGIAIKTTVAQLLSFLPSEGRLRRVQYLDYKKDRVITTSPVYCKRHEFSHEREVRAVIPREFDEFPVGLAINVNVSKLINEVRLSPDIPKWSAELVEKIVKRYGLSIPVNKSELDNNPVFNWYISKD